ncbi:sphingosine-1-phosphate phosphatase 2 isoform X2 [Erinaceus europaeus]|uniref:Sphingosine-1-phosphate phosphatase 2 isoform X2 n=1 Tax=Erinaceus europaeus TaxID=9365 RepID=A0ABM3XLH1_ERIEU|nr:sphingosine-1-phosphate phosphatase 2 isoform X2 [Erinaceus europaeus]
MAQLVRSLRDSRLVARFQRRCGLFPAPQAGPQEQGASRPPRAGPDKGGSRGPPNGLRRSWASQANVQEEYIVKNYFYYYLFRFSAALGQEVFYITFLPFTHWNVDPYLSRRLVIIWVYPFVLGLMMAVVFSTLVCLSRLYTGMHTVLDVLGGVLITATLIAITYPAWPLIDSLHSASPVLPVCVIVVPFLLCYHYPVSDAYTPTRADTTTILAAGAGVTLGLWINHFFQLVAEPAQSLPALRSIPPLTRALVLQGLAKFTVGLLLVLLVRLLVQKLSLQVLFSWFKVVVRNKEARRRLEIEVPYKFVTYTSVGICATTFVPLLHRVLGLL